MRQSRAVVQLSRRLLLKSYCLVYHLGSFFFLHAKKPPRPFVSDQGPPLRRRGIFRFFLENEGNDCGVFFLLLQQNLLIISKKSKYTIIFPSFGGVSAAKPLTGWFFQGMKEVMKEVMEMKEVMKEVMEMKEVMKVAEVMNIDVLILFYSKILNNIQF